MQGTYFIDIDGVLVRHFGDLSSQIAEVEALPSTRKLINDIDKAGGKIILTTGRRESMRNITENQLTKIGVFYDILVMGCNRGARVLINDKKPYSSLKTAFSFCPDRNSLSPDEAEKIINPCEDRPWGSFSTLAYNNDYHIKEITVAPGKSSSLQSHKQREEIWVVFKGSGTCQINNEIIPISVGSVCKVELGAKHRVSNTGDKDLMFIEIQTGEGFAESDITRYEDDFGRA